VKPVAVGGAKASASTTAPVSSARADGSQSASSIVIPTEDGGQVMVREPVKTVGEGDDEIELRSRTPEEKAKRRLIKNLVLWGFGLVFIAIVLITLLTTGPISP
jgi:hypothetical protein